MTTTTPCPTCQTTIPAGAECQACADLRRHQDDQLATVGTNGGIVDDLLLAKSGKSGGFAEDEELAGSGRKGGFAADDTELA